MQSNGGISSFYQPAMSVDFLNRELGTTAFTNVVSSDGYEVGNLLVKPVIENSIYPKIEMTFPGSKATPVHRHDHGFMADYFVKPPVDIVVQFPCLLDITKIVVNRRSGAKRVAEFLISSANAKPNFAPNKPYKDCKNDSTLDFPCKFEPDFSLTEIRKQERSGLHTIGRFSSRGTEADIIIFNNPRRGCNDIDKNMKQGAHTVPLFSLQYLYGVSHLILRILRTEESTVAAIKRLEAWGRPSTQNKATLNDKIYALIRQYNDRCIQELNFQNCNQTTVNIEMEDEKKQQSEENATQTQDKNQDATSNGPIVPEDFIDPITCEVMILPVLLPSGLSIDSATLEKCMKGDERNGRMPLDPFTGIPLGVENKAVPNTALKLRIDSFLLQKGVNLGQHSNFRQTTGVNLLNRDVVKQVVNNKRKSRDEMPGERDFRRARVSNLVINACPVSNNGVLVNNVPQKKIVKAPERCQPWSCDKSRIAECGKSLLKEKMSTSYERIRYFKNSTEESHEETLQNSLEIALKKVDSSVLKPKKENSDQQRFTCSSCKRHGKEVHLFQLHCHHLVCRQCIQDMSRTKKCTICFKTFSNGQVVRVHFSEYFGS